MSNSASLRKIGVVVAIEIDSVLKKYGEPAETIEKHGFTVRTFKNENCIMYVVDSGAGEISAATSVQMLISEFGVDMVLNFGVVGGLVPEMASTELCVVDSIIHYDFVTTGWLNLKTGQYPNHDSQFIKTTPALVEKALSVDGTLRKVVCASADKFVDSAEDKTALREAYGADICEMEAAGIALTCERNGVDCLLIKAVADSLTGRGKEFFEALNDASDACFDLLDKVIKSL